MPSTSKLIQLYEEMQWSYMLKPVATGALIVFECILASSSKVQKTVWVRVMSSDTSFGWFPFSLGDDESKYSVFSLTEEDEEREYPL